MYMYICVLKEYITTKYMYIYTMYIYNVHLHSTYMYICVYIFFACSGQYDGALGVYTRIFNETKGKAGTYMYVHNYVL